MRYATRQFHFLLLLPAALLLVSCAPAAELENTPAILCLKTNLQSAAQPQAIRSNLEREFARQAVLMAARDMGCATRDSLLREPFPDENSRGAFVLEVTVFRDTTQKKQWCVLADKANTQKTLEALNVSGNLAGLPQWEELSRTQIPEALKALGLAGTISARALKSDAEAPLPKEVEELLGNLSPFKQFAAVRMLHRLVRESGESPNRLAALARGYANLGIQAENLYVAVRKVYLARAYLYAQRLARLQDTPNARRTLAYVCAMHGNNVRALEELEKAAKLDETLSKDNKPLAPVPPWLTLTVHYAKSRFNELAKEAGKAGADRATIELATYLRCLALLNAGDAIALAACEDAFKLNQDNVKIVCAQCCIGGVSHLHAHTLIGFELMARNLSGCLTLFPELSASSRAALTGCKSSPTALAQAARALIDAGAPGKDYGEPSLAALGRLSQEIHFAFVRYRLNFMRHSWSVPTEDAARAFLPLVEDHPFKGVILAMSQSTPDAAACLKEIQPLNPSVLATNLPWDVWQLSKPAPPQQAEWKAAAQQDLSESVWDIIQSLHGLNMRLLKDWNRGRELCGEMLKIDPQGVNGPIWLLSYFTDDKELAAKIQTWEERLAFHPAVQRGLAKHYEKKKQVQKALQYWQKFLESGSDPEAYQHLAKAYLAAGDEAKWLATLKEVLKLPDTALTHSNINAQIAWHFMDKTDYVTALPYAEESAQSGAAWAMSCAAECHEMMGNYDKSAQWWEHISQRYDESTSDYYFFWLRTQKGDLEKARALALKDTSKFIRAAFDVCEGKAAQAKDIHHDFLVNRGLDTILIGSFILQALFADEAKDTKQRDEYIQRAMTKKLKPDDKVLVPLQTLAKLMQGALAKGERTSLDETGMAVLKSVMPKHGSLGLFAARFETLHGSKEKAKEYFTLNFRTKQFHVKRRYHNTSDTMYGMLTAFWGRELGIDLIALTKEVRAEKAKTPAAATDDF